MREFSPRMLKKLILLILFFMGCLPLYASSPLISLFPIEHYNQSIENWIKPNDPDYDQQILSKAMQQKRWQLFYKHYFGDLSPWNKSYIQKIIKLSATDSLASIEKNILQTYSNRNKSEEVIGYGENFRPYSQQWIDTIANNIDLEQLNTIRYHAANRAITVENLYVRTLPIDEPHFYSHEIAGQGYPFDNLQISSIWVGTPVYIFQQTRDRAWSLIISPDYIGWVKTRGIARVSSSFIHAWKQAAKKNLMAIVRTETPITDANKHFLFSAYVGTVFPAKHHRLMVPIAQHQNAHIQYVVIPKNSAVRIPLSTTPHHFANVMQTLIGRTYGWGNLYFYNDCSAELKNLFTPFGIWLPRHSSHQLTAGQQIDFSKETKEKRLAYLLQNGKKFMTLIYVGGHIVLYIGNDTDQNNVLQAMTYQNIWALKPEPAVRRSVIGQSVFLPLLSEYPEDKDLVSLAGKKYFQLSYLDQLPEPYEEKMDLKELMSAE